MNKTRISSWAGINTREDVGAAAFQPPQRGDRDPRMHVVELNGGYVTDDRRIEVLPSTEIIATGTSWGAQISIDAGLLVHDRGVGKIILNPGDYQDVLVDGLSDAPMAWVNHQGLVYWACDDVRGRITQDGVNLPWALPQAPTPAVTATTGIMPAGRYLVSVTWLDSTNTESGCEPSTEAVLSSTGGLRISIDTPPLEVYKVRIYVSPPNGQHPALVAEVDAAAFPYNVTVAHTETGTKSLIPLRTQGLIPMPAGSGFTTRGGFLLTWADNVLWFSAGQWAHLCDASRNLFVFPANVQYAVGLDTGVWVITTRGAYWIEGADLLQARIVPVTARRTYATGGARISALDAFGMQASQDVAVFASSEGPVVGTADGQLVAPLKDSQSWDVSDKVAQIALIEYNGTRLMVFNIRGDV